MRFIRGLVLKTVRRRRLRDELEAEMAFHQEMAASNGARIPFGNPSVLKESALDLWRFNLLENLARDISFALRRLSQSPGYTTAAIGSLALGIGISAAMFTLLNAVLFRPLPYADESRLVWFSEVLKANSTYQITLTPDFLDWRRLNHSFEDIAGITYQTSVITGLGRPMELNGVRAAASLLPILEVQPMLGRNFTREEDIAGGGHVIIVAHSFWREHLHSDPAAIGKPIALDGEPYRVVGVLPAGFVFPSDGDVQFITPLARNEAGELARDGRVITTVHGVFGRLKPGVTIPQARANIAAIQSHLPLPPWRPTITIKMLPLRTFLFGDQKLTASVLVIGALLFLLVASANLGNLALSQLMQRERELAVRRALGAPRSRVIAQLLVENTLLATSAALIGLFIAWAVRNLLASMPSYAAEIYARLPLDFHVVLFTTCLLALVVLVFGLIPALRISDIQLASAMKASQLTTTGRRDHLRFLSLVAATEIAIVVGLSTSAVLMVKSFWNLRYRELGIQSEHVTAATLNLTASKYWHINRELSFLDALLTRTKVIAGVEAAALSVASEIPPGGGGHVIQTASIEGRPLPMDSRSKPQTKYQVVSAGYLDALRIPLVNGRFVSETDGPSAPPVVVVSQEFARRYFPHQNPIGHRLHAGDMRDGVWHAIVGVVGDVKSSGPASPPEPLLYVPYGQSTGGFLHDLGLVVRSPLPMTAIAPALRDVVASIDPEQPISSIETVDHRWNESVARPAFTASLLSALSLLGTLLAIIGVYGLVSCRVRSQLRELAVRQALGAPAWLLIGQFVQNAAVVTVSGLAFGLAITLASTHLLSAMLFEVSPREPLVLGGVCGVVLIAAISACVVPAWKAMRSDPLVVLREN